MTSNPRTNDIDEADNGGRYVEYLGYVIESLHFQVCAGHEHASEWCVSEYRIWTDNGASVEHWDFSIEPRYCDTEEQARIATVAIDRVGKAGL